jgi:hypothetical protein
MSVRGQASWARMTSPGGKLIALVCHSTKRVNKATNIALSGIYAECQNQAHHAECRYAECRFTESRGAGAKLRGRAVRTRFMRFRRNGLKTVIKTKKLNKLEFN